MSPTPLPHDGTRTGSRPPTPTRCGPPFLRRRAGRIFALCMPSFPLGVQSDGEEHGPVGSVATALGEHAESRFRRLSLRQPVLFVPLLRQSGGGKPAPGVKLLAAPGDRHRLAGFPILNRRDAHSYF